MIILTTFALFFYFTEVSIAQLRRPYNRCPLSLRTEGVCCRKGQPDDHNLFEDFCPSTWFEDKCVKLKLFVDDQGCCMFPGNICAVHGRHVNYYDDDIHVCLN